MTTKGVVLITGGTGNIGRRLSDMLLKEGYQIIILSRKPSPGPGTAACRYGHWDPATGEIDAAAISEADYIVNLAGAGIADKRWTAKRKRLIKNSRVQAGNLLVEALSDIPNKVKAVVSASAVGYYGPNHSTANLFSEDAPAASDFLGSTCLAWEGAVQPAATLGKRLVILRTAVVLDSRAGAYRELAAPLKFRLATILGSGKQRLSWIHIEDMCRIILFALSNESMNGVYNAAAPQPATNAEMVKHMAALRYGTGYLTVKVPAFVLGAALGEMAHDALLQDAAVSAAKLQDAGFKFLFADLRNALSQLNQKHV